jgi:hypothetical protein
MSQESLADLQKSHQALEDQITEAMLHKAVDDLEIVDLKRTLTRQLEPLGVNKIGLGPTFPVDGL